MTFSDIICLSTLPTEQIWLYWCLPPTSSCFSISSASWFWCCQKGRLHVIHFVTVSTNALRSCKQFCFGFVFRSVLKHVTTQCSLYIALPEFDPPTLLAIAFTVLWVNLVFNDFVSPETLPLFSAWSSSCSCFAEEAVYSSCIQSLNHLTSCDLVNSFVPDLYPWAILNIKHPTFSDMNMVFLVSYSLSVAKTLNH